MSDAWNNRRKANEEKYFEEQNKKAMEKLASKKDSSKLSPATGKPMEQFTFMGLTLDKCKDTGGVWFDGGELEQLLEKLKNEDKGWFSNWLETILKS